MNDETVPAGQLVEADQTDEKRHPIAGGGHSVLAVAKDVLDIETSTDERASRVAELTAWLFRHEEEPRRIAVEDLSRLVSDDANFLWIDLADYNESDLRTVAGQLHLSPLGVHTALSRWQRPRLDIFGDDYFVTVTLAQLDQDQLRIQAGELDMFVGRNYLVSTHKLPLPLEGRVMTRARHHPTLMQDDSAYMLYIILDELLSHYETLKERIQGTLEEMEERALTDTSDQFLSDLLRFKRYSFALSQLADQHLEVFTAFLRPDFPFVSGGEMSAYFRDLEARLSRLLSDLASARDAVNGAFDIYVSQMTHRTNQVIRVLTIVSTTILPVTIIVSFFGTSFRSLPIYSPPDFIIMLVVIALVTGFTLLTFRRRGWL